MLFWSCFEELDDSRLVNDNGPCRLQPGDVRDWCLVHGLDDADSIAETWAVVRLVDRQRCERLRRKIAGAADDEDDDAEDGDPVDADA